MEEFEVVRVLHGSKLFGLDTPTSDTDYKGVYLPSLRDCFRGEIAHCRNHSTSPDHLRNTQYDTDFEQWSLQRFLSLIETQDISALDMLAAPESAILTTSEIWERLQQNKAVIFNKNIAKLKEYIQKQMSRYGVKGSKFDTIKQIIAALQGYGKTTRLSDVLGELPMELPHVEMKKDSGDLIMLQVCGRCYQELMKTSYVIEQLQIVLDNYSARVKEAAENQNVDWKAVSHAFRACYLVLELTKNIEFTYPLPQTDFLMQLKQGNVNYVEDGIRDKLEALLDEVIKEVNQTAWPDKFNSGFTDDFLMDTYFGYLG